MGLKCDEQKMGMGSGMIAVLLADSVEIQNIEFRFQDFSLE
jgi:hypothetical protein